MLVNSKGLKKLSFAGGSASPFIDKRDGFTSERVRIRMLLGSIAHAGRYKIMVGTYNTVDCHCRMSDAHGRLRCLLQKWQMSVPANTIDAKKYVRSFTMFTRYGKSRRPQHYRCQRHVGGLTVWEFMAPTIL